MSLKQKNRSLKGVPEKALVTSMRLLFLLLISALGGFCAFHAHNLEHQSQSYGQVLMAGAGPNTRKWPKKISYRCDLTVHEYFDGSMWNIVEEAIAWFNTNTCVQFKNSTGTAADKEAWMYFTMSEKTNGPHKCSNVIGRNWNPPLPDLIAVGCARQVETVIMLIAARLGMTYEQLRLDRNRFVKVYPQNSEYPDLMKAQNSDDLLPVPYDYASLLQRDSHFTSKNGKVTIEAKNGIYKDALGSLRVQAGDIYGINHFYNCFDECAHIPQPQCKNQGMTNPRNCTTCLCPPMYRGPLCGQLAPAINTDAGTCGEILKATNTLQKKTFQLKKNAPFHFRGIECFVEITKTNSTKNIKLTIEKYNQNVPTFPCVSGTQVYLNGNFFGNPVTFCNYESLKAAGSNVMVSNEKIVIRFYLTGQDKSTQDYNSTLAISFIQS